MRRSPQFGVLVLVSALPLLAAAWQWNANLTYQNRGRYREGLRTDLSTGPRLDLLSATADPPLAADSLPAEFQASFYLPGNEPVYLTVREIDNRYGYWLDDVRPESGWRPEARNVFTWSTATVVRFLSYRDRPLALRDLGAVARLDRKEPGPVERVVPVALGAGTLPKQVESYRFAFRPGSRMRLKFDVASARTAAPAAAPQVFPAVPASEPHVVVVEAKGWETGWYRLAVTGYDLQTNARLNAEVQFYHVREPGI